MRWIHSLRFVLTSLLRRRRMDQEMEEELQSHYERQLEAYLAAGMSLAEARRAVRGEFGGMSGLREECREVTRLGWIENLWRDLRHAARGLLRQPLMTGASIVSLALGIGATTVIYSVIREIVFMPPTAHRPDRMVSFWMGHGSHVSYQEWRDVEIAGPLAGIAGYQMEREVNVTLGEETRAVLPFLVTANFFDVLGVPAARGRTFTTADARAELDPRVVVLSHGFWQRRLGGDTGVVGRALKLNGERYTIIGVLPRVMRSVFGYGLTPEVYLPLNRHLMPDLYAPRESIVSLIARLPDGLTVTQGRAALMAAGERIALTYPPGRKTFGAIDRFESFTSTSRLTEIPVTPFLTVLGVVVGLVLLIACANVASLLLARGTARYRETAVRLSLGAGRFRLIQHLLCESLLLSLAGAGAGLLLNEWLAGVLNRPPLPTPIPFEFHIRTDLALVLACSILAVVTSLLCGLLPAIQLTRPALAPVLKQDEPRFARSRLGLRKALVAGQIAVSAVLLVTAILFVRNLWRATVVHPGFDVDRVVWAEVALVPHRYTGDKQRLFVAEAAEALSVLPGVQSVSYADGVPLTIYGGSTRGGDLEFDGASRHVDRSVNWIGRDYFRTMGIPLLTGREFAARESGSPVIINRRLAEMFAGGHALGKTIRVERRERLEVIGVVADSKYRTLGENPRRAMYFPYNPRGGRVQFLVRGPAAVTPQVNRALRELDPSGAVESRSMRDGLAFALLPSRLGAAFLGSLGILGLVLALVGLYGVIAYSVSRRTAEIGVRMALGATRASILRMTMKDGLLSAGAGLAIGLALAFVVTQPLAEFLVPGLQPADPLSFLCAAIVLGMAAVLAGLAPARRAARIEPVSALRYE